MHLCQGEAGIAVVPEILPLLTISVVLLQTEQADLTAAEQMNTRLLPRYLCLKCEKGLCVCVCVTGMERTFEPQWSRPARASAPHQGTVSSSIWLAAEVPLSIIHAAAHRVAFASADERRVSGEALRKPGAHPQLCGTAVSARLLAKVLSCWAANVCVCVCVCRNGEKVYKLTSGNSSSSDFPRLDTSQPRSVSLMPFL